MKTIIVYSLKALAFIFFFWLPALMIMITSPIIYYI